MKKSYFFGLALLFGATTGYAQKNIASLADLKEVKTGLDSLDAWQKEYDNREGIIANYEIEKSKLAPTVAGKDVKVVWKYAEDLKKALTDFDNSVHAETSAGSEVKDKYLWFAIKYGTPLTTSQQSLAPINRAVTRKASLIVLYDDKIKESLSAEDKGLVWKKVRGYDVTESSKEFIGSNTVASVRLYYYDKKYTRTVDENGNNIDVEVSGYKSTLASLFIETPITVDYDFVTLFAGNVDKMNFPVEKESTEPGKDEVNPAIATMQKAIDDLTAINKTLKAKIDAVATYKELNLTQSFTINSEDASFTLALPAGSTFKGGNNTITGSKNSVSLFSTNGGTISNVNVVNLPLVGTNNGDISNVNGQNCNIVNRNNGDISNVTVTDGRVTVEKGTNSHIINSLDGLNGESSVYGSDASFATVKAADASTYYNIYNNKTLRNEFGVAVTTGIVSKGSNNKLYEVTMYYAGNKTGETRLANIDGNGKPEIKRDWTTTGVGEFYYISDADAGSVFDGITGDNIEKNVVYTHDGSNWECKVAEVSNGANSIYIPRAFKAAKVKYDRNFNVSAQNASTICLPFAVSASVVESALGTNGHLLQFNKIDENGQTYWFKYVTGGIEANQPYVLLFGQNVNSKFFDGLSNVEFAATGEGQDLKALSQSSVAAGASLYGTFEKRTASELEDGAKHSIYGFQNGQFVRMTDAVNFNATRAYVRNDKWTDPKAPNAAKAYKLGVLDENGNEVTGISSVENAADEFTVNGGNGAISINADKAQNVKVYTVGGALVKSVDVEAGATSLPVSAGMYIVNGNKVVVK